MPHARPPEHSRPFSSAAASHRDQNQIPCTLTGCAHVQQSQRTRDTRGPSGRRTGSPHGTEGGLCELAQVGTQAAEHTDTCTTPSQMGKFVSKRPSGQAAICLLCLLPVCGVLDKNSGYSSGSDVLHYKHCGFPRSNGLKRKINMQAALILLFPPLSYFGLDQR